MKHLAQKKPARSRVPRPCGVRSGGCRACALTRTASFRASHPAHELGSVGLDHAWDDAGAGVLAVALGLDEPGLDQLLEVVRDRRLGDRELVAEGLIGALVLGGDDLEDGEAARVGERLRDALELTGRELTGCSGWHVHSFMIV